MQYKKKEKKFYFTICHNCPLNLPLGVTVDPFSKQARPVKTVDRPQRKEQERKEKQIEAEKRRGYEQYMEGGRSHKTGGWMICHTCDLTNRQTAAKGRAPEQRRALSTATRHTMSPAHCTAS